MSGTKILLTGATGYIGGSILYQLLKSHDEAIKSSQLSVLVRGTEKAKAFSEAGINPILFNSLDESDVLEKAASEHDIVIHTASGFHTGSAVALIKGLGTRKAAVGGEPRYIHTSGTSNLGDRPITGTYHESHEFSDKDDLYSYMKSREAGVAYPQRTTDLAVIEIGREVGIKTYIIMSPTIYGVGTGAIGNPNILSIQVPILIRAAIKAGQAEVIEEGKGVWDYVHVADLAALYELLVARVLRSTALRSGEHGIYFSAVGRYTWKELSQGVADAGYKLGALKSNEVKSISLEEAAVKWSNGDIFLAELGFASYSRTNSEMSRELGWEPKKTADDFKNHFLEEFSIIYNGTH